MTRLRTGQESNFSSFAEMGKKCLSSVHCSKNPCGPSKFLSDVYRRLFLGWGVKRPGREADSYLHLVRWLIIIQGTLLSLPPQPFIASTATGLFFRRYGRLLYIEWSALLETSKYPCWYVFYWQTFHFYITLYSFNLQKYYQLAATHTCIFFFSFQDGDLLHTY